MSRLLSRKARWFPFAAAVASTLIALAGASAVVPTPTVIGPIPDSQGTRGHALWDSWFQLTPFGYEEAEFFISGTARAHPAGSAPDAAYTTRIIVTRPSSAADFNGTVMLDWTNVTAQFENAVDIVSAYPMLLRDGYAYVHVSAQAAGVCCTPLTPQAWDPVRYGALNHPGDAYSFDMLAQIAQAMKAPATNDPMGGLVAERVIASGQSQSGSRLRTYVTEIQNGIGEDVIDAFIVHGSGGSSKPTLSVQAQAPMIHLLSDAEYSAAEPDPNASPNYVLWEIAGTAHSDFWIGNNSELGGGPRSQLGAPKQDPTGLAAVQLIAGNYGEQVTPGSLVCIAQGAQFPMRYAASAAIDALHRWLRDGVPPPQGPRFQDNGSGGLARDGFGNALGGIRLAPIDVPIAQYQSTACPLGGITVPFDETQILSLYPTHANYFCQMQAAAAQNVRDDFLLAPDADDLLTRAAAAQNRWPGDLGSPDCDGDGIDDAIDNCPLVANPLQLDSGGINTTTPDGIGDACQCGDVSGNGIVNGQDANAIRRHGLGLTPNPLYVDGGKCDVSGNGSCNGQDGNAVRAVALGVPNPAFGQRCQNADLYAPECPNCQ